MIHWLLLHRCFYSISTARKGHSRNAPLRTLLPLLIDPSVDTLGLSGRSQTCTEILAVAQDHITLQGRTSASGPPQRELIVSTGSCSPLLSDRCTHCTSNGRCDGRTLALYLSGEGSRVDLKKGLTRGQEVDCIDREYARPEEGATVEVGGATGYRYSPPPRTTFPPTRACACAGAFHSTSSCPSRASAPGRRANRHLSSWYVDLSQRWKWCTFPSSTSSLASNYVPCHLISPPSTGKGCRLQLQ